MGGWWSASYSQTTRSIIDCSSSTVNAVTMMNVWRVRWSIRHIRPLNPPLDYMYDSRNASDWSYADAAMSFNWRARMQDRRVLDFSQQTRSVFVDSWWFELDLQTTTKSGRAQLDSRHHMGLQRLLGDFPAFSSRPKLTFRWGNRRPLETP